MSNENNAGVDLDNAVLDKLEALARAATPGPWSWWTSNSTLRLTGADGRDGGVLYAYAHSGSADIACSVENQQFIAAANPAAILALIDLARAPLPEQGDERCKACNGEGGIFTSPGGFAGRCSLCKGTGQHHGPAQAVNDARDAARYRFLRNPDQPLDQIIDKKTGYVPKDEMVSGVGGYHTYEYRAGNELDAAIDAAMSASRPDDKGGKS